MIFELARGRKFIVLVNNKDNRVFMSRNYRSDSCPLENDLLNTSIIAREEFFVDNYKKVIKREQYYSFLSFESKTALHRTC